ncbi:DNA-binding protein [Sporosarcina aquimarina]|uniref:DNA-binding protein n=1 Tax=Sporosarcina aquimarina TaxID=114975 RepID=UPI00203F7419|nr:DNA-binding protein [Sporosarcina aquimarina]MCM3759155.1 DNA-binding protein [Sporosarcina aquimarina]
MENGFGYFSKDVAIELEITTSTLRRWAIELEKQGYSFQRNEKEQRIYYEHDFKAFRELKKLLANSVPFVDSINAVATRDFVNENAQKMPSVYSETMRLSKREIEDIVKKAIEDEREILLDALEKRMSDTIEMRDRLLTQQLRAAIDESHKQLAAASHPSEKKSWWKRLFKKEKESCK